MKKEAKTNQETETVSVGINPDGSIKWENHIGDLQKEFWLKDGKFENDIMKADYFRYMIACKQAKITEVQSKVASLEKEIADYNDKLMDLAGETDPVKLAQRKAERAKEAFLKAMAALEEVGGTLPDEE